MPTGTSKAAPVSRDGRDMAVNPQRDDSLRRDGFIRTVELAGPKFICYVRVSVGGGVPHRKNITRAGWADWADGAERWDE